MDVFVLALLAFVVQIVTNVIVLIKVIPLIKIKKDKKVDASALFNTVSKSDVDISSLLKSLGNTDEHI